MAVCYQTATCRYNFAAENGPALLHLLVLAFFAVITLGDEFLLGEFDDRPFLFLFLVVDFDFDGEMQGDAALDERIRMHDLPSSNLKGSANLLILPTLDAANIAFNLLKTATGSASIGPILLGANKPVHILTPSATARRVVNMTALAVTEAQDLENGQ